MKEVGSHELPFAIPERTDLSRTIAAALVWLAAFGAAGAFAQEAIPVPTPRPTPNISAPANVTAAIPSSCQKELAKSGAIFTSVLPKAVETNGCLIADPIELNTLPGGVALVPDALLDCPTALRFARFAAGTIQPLATKTLSSRITVVRQDSAFVCRPRNGTTKLSEHAFGRAIDIGAFTTEAGLVIPVMAMPKVLEIEANFLTAVRAAACGPFATVLGPGSNSDHAMHFHFDLAPRKGSAYCR